MASLRGERFHIPLDNNADDEYDAFEKDIATAEEESSSADQASHPLSAFANLVGDIKERSPLAATSRAGVIPKAPEVKSSATGFPQPRKRVPVSRFKSQRRDADGDDTGLKEHGRSPASEKALSSAPLSDEDTVRREIDEENRAKLARMSQSEIAQERSELMNSLSPSLVQRLLQRSTIDDTVSPNGNGYPNLQNNPGVPNEPYEDLSTTGDSSKKPSKKVAFDVSPQTAKVSLASTDQVQDSEPLDKDLDDRPAPPFVLENPPQMHFPKPVQPPELDPSDPEFFDSLHEKYFPSLPADPSKLAWMTSTVGDGKSYDPNAESLQASQLRFGFKGELLAPRTAQSIPVSKGLHHHGDAPESAGYTVRELAHLSRSSVATQRCIAYQILGRLMYRLGKGQYGDDELCKGLWRCVEEGRVLDTLQGEVDKKSGHMSAKAYATDALWLWQRGGGKRLGTG